MLDFVSMEHPEFITGLRYSRTGNKNGDIVWQHCCKTCRVLPPTFKPSLQQIRSVAGCEKVLRKVESSSNFETIFCNLRQVLFEDSKTRNIAFQLVLQ